MVASYCNTYNKYIHTYNTSIVRLSRKRFVVGNWTRNLWLLKGLVYNLFHNWFCNPRDLCWRITLICCVSANVDIGHFVETRPDLGSKQTESPSCFSVFCRICHLNLVINWYWRLHFWFLIAHCHQPLDFVRFTELTSTIVALSIRLSLWVRFIVGIGSSVRL